ncbi:hypothetical protein J132_06844, partial [Termitomyces sp. J132]
VYGEVYTSDEFLELEKMITPVEVLPLMFYSDSTHLTNFGTASLWPLYMWFGNISKYIHSKVSSFSAHHLAYLPSNAFSQLLLPNGQNYFDLFVHDLIHEFELGIWRSVFEHLIQMLHTYEPNHIEELDCRLYTPYCQISPFGHSTICKFWSTICKFWNDLSAMQSFAARDYEDLLQNAGPCFEGLFGEQEHKHVKAFYAQTNKNQFEGQSRAIEQAIQETIEEEELPPTDPEEHHYISKTKQIPLNLFQWIKDHEKDLAIMNFKYKLNEHLLICLLPFNTEIADQNHGKLIIRDNMIYEHKTLCINYPTYDNQHDQDTLNPQWQSDVMVVADNNVHPYWYFRIVKIFHALVQLNESEQRGLMELDDNAKSGFAAKCCYQIGFVEGEDTFGFVNLADVLCAVHLIPQFAGSHTNDLLALSMAHCIDEGNLDYE